MRTLRTREKRLLSTTLVIGCSLLVYTKVVEPRIARAIDLWSFIEQTESQLAESRALIDHKEEIIALSEWLRRQIAPKGGDDLEMNALFEEVDHLATESRLKDTNIRRLKPKEFGYYRLFNVELTAEGQDRDVANFLHSIGTSEQLLRVDQVNVYALRKPGTVRAEFLIVKILNPRGNV